MIKVIIQFILTETLNNCIVKKQIFNEIRW